jgi:hypothetical protein
MDTRIAVDGCQDGEEIHIKRKIVDNKRCRRAFKYKPRTHLPYPDNPLADDTIPPSISGAIPSEYLATAKCLIQ